MKNIVSSSLLAWKSSFHFSIELNYAGDSSVLCADAPCPPVLPQEHTRPASLSACAAAALFGRASVRQNVSMPATLVLARSHGGTLSSGCQTRSGNYSESQARSDLSADSDSESRPGPDHSGWQFKFSNGPGPVTSVLASVPFQSSKLE